MVVTACNDSLNAKTLNVKSISAMCDKCVLIDKHDMCVLNSVAKPIKRTFTPSGYKWKPKSGKDNVNPNVSMPLGNASRTANVIDTMTSRDGENLNKMKEKGDECIFMGYSNQSRAYRVFNKRTRSMALNYDNLSPANHRQANVPQADRTVSTSNELDLLFSPMFDELLNGSFKVVFKSSAVSAADAPNQCQHHTTPLNNHTTPAPTYQVPTLAPTVISPENINQAETYAENDQVADDEFINIFSTLVQDQGETSSRHVDSSNMHTFYQRYPSEHRWTKDHP
nr:hypothetical protein [Tanacetum cinerariifolium]